LKPETQRIPASLPRHEAAADKADAAADHVERQKLIAPGAAVGVTEEMIAQLVRTFYAKVRQDPTLGPIFNRHVENWDEHLSKLCDFWSSVTLMTRRFSGSPMAAHAQVAAIQPVHFVRWLQLFNETAQSLCPPAAAELFTAKAEMIGRSLRLGIAVSRGELPRTDPAR
jgi:hemoglobin